MHAKVYHVPQMIKEFGNIKQFSGQGTHTTYKGSPPYVFVINALSRGLGVEKNDDARRNYRSSNHWDDMLTTEFRLEQGSKHERNHRTYNKHKLEYWFGGGIQEDRRKRQKLD